MPPPCPENFFILTIEATKNRGQTPLEIEKWLGSPPWSPRGPSPGKIPAYALAFRLDLNVFINDAERQ